MNMIFLAMVALSQQAPITVDNIEPGSVVRHPVIALEGTVQGNDIVVGASWPTAVRFPAVNGRWRGFVELKPGQNMVLLYSGRTTVRYRIDYQPATTPYKVMTLFVQASDEGDRYHSDRPGMRFQAREKLDVAMKLMQSATAEAMNMAGYGRKTFDLEYEPDGRVKVRTVVLPKTGDEMRAMEGNESWGYIYGEVKRQLPEDTARWCGVLGFTSFDRDERKALGHYALGGGALALFGGGTMGWWPATMKDVPAALADTTFIDPARMFEDSANRRTVWANVSTAYGAMLHELGHTFGLPHSPDRFSVMSRGFDFFSRWFTPVESPVHGKTDSVHFAPDERMRWDPFFAARLNLSPWFQPDGALVSRRAAPRITLDGEDVLIEAEAGLRVWGADRDDKPAVFHEFRDAVGPSSLKLSRNELRQKLGTDQVFRIVAVDAEGRQTTIEDKG
jgi:hypothetical protein